VAAFSTSASPLTLSFFFDTEGRHRRNRFFFFLSFFPFLLPPPRRNPRPDARNSLGGFFSFFEEIESPLQLMPSFFLSTPKISPFLPAPDPVRFFFPSFSCCRLPSFSGEKNAQRLALRQPASFPRPLREGQCCFFCASVNPSVYPFPSFPRCTPFFFLIPHGSRQCAPSFFSLADVFVHIPFFVFAPVQPWETLSALPGHPRCPIFSSFFVVKPLFFPSFCKRKEHVFPYLTTLRGLFRFVFLLRADDE